MGYVSDLRSEVGTRPLVLAGAALIVIDDLGRILVQLRSDMNLWGIPGGAVELNETVEETAKRELYEEMSIVADELNLVFVASGPKYQVVLPNSDEIHNVTTVFTCRQWRGDPIADGNEALDVGWLDPRDRDRSITPFLERLLIDVAAFIEQESE